MSNLDPNTAVRTARRGEMLARLTRFALFAAAATGMALTRGPLLPVGLGLLLGAVGGGIALGTRSARIGRALLHAAALADVGEFADADRLTGVALRRFNVARRARVLALRTLARARHGQHQYPDARILAEAALRYRQPKAEADALRLLVAEGALEAADLPAAHAALSAVTLPLALGDSLKLLELQTDYCVRIGAWPHVTHDLAGKVELAELLPAEAAASVQAMLALAARRLNQTAWSDWLVRRAALLVDAEVLVRRRPVLRELFVTGS